MLSEASARRAATAAAATGGAEGVLRRGAPAFVRSQLFWVIRAADHGRSEVALQQTTKSVKALSKLLGNQDATVHSEPRAKCGFSNVLTSVRSQGSIDGGSHKRALKHPKPLNFGFRGLQKMPPVEGTWRRDCRQSRARDLASTVASVLAARMLGCCLGSKNRSCKKNCRWHMMGCLQRPAVSVRGVSGDAGEGVCRRKPGKQHRYCRTRRDSMRFPPLSASPPATCSECMLGDMAQQGF